MIEQFTDEEHAELEWAMPQRASAKALRIIDAQAARIAELVAPFRATYNAGFTTANANATGSKGPPFGFDDWLKANGGGAR